jgi:AcrR family transcriptional regulator
MAHLANETRRRILDAAYGLFYRSGFGRIGVDDIAAAAGVTKRTLYYHFESKDALLGAVLELQSELAAARLLKRRQRYSGSAERMVSTLFSDLVDWSLKPGWTGAGFTRLAMELADLPGHPARIVADRHKLATQAWWRDLLRLAGVPQPARRARELMLVLEGAMALILIHGDRSYADDAARAARKLVGLRTRRLTATTLSPGMDRKRAGKRRIRARRGFQKINRVG